MKSRAWTWRECYAEHKFVSDNTNMEWTNMSVVEWTQTGEEERMYTIAWLSHTLHLNVGQMSEW